MNGRFTLVFTGAILMPTMVLVALVIQATVQREDWLDLRLERLHREWAEATAEAVGARVETRAHAALARVEAALQGPSGTPGDLAALEQAEAGDALVHHVFLLDTSGGLLWPQMPSPSLARSLATEAAPTYPVLLNPLQLERRNWTTAGLTRERYIEALAVYEPLLRQSDPWLRLVAADLMARSYSELEEWPLALEIYERMARDFGQGLDAGGVPIELGVRLEIANIHYRMGAQEQFLNGYLATYERLVDRTYALPEQQRRHLVRITREALAGVLDAQGEVHVTQGERFAEIRHRETLQAGREDFIRQMWTHGIGEAIATAALEGSEGHTVREVDGAPTTFFWRRQTEGVAGFAADPQALLAELRHDDALRPGADFHPVMRDVSGAFLVGGPEALPVVWGARVDPMPQWEVGVVPLEAEATRGTATLHVWLAVLAVIGLGGGVYGLARMVAGRLRTARLQADFVSGVSHELRTPLTSIRLLIEMLLDGRGADEGERHSYMETIQRDAQRLERVVGNVLTFSRSEKTALSFDREAVDMAQIAARAVESSQQAAAQRQVQLRVSAEAELPVVWGDAHHLESVVRNLLDNALRYGEAGEPIDVKIESGNGQVWLSVCDRGPGVPARECRRIFQPFYRGQLGLRQAKAGTGLGLALVERIVEGHGGTVETRPREGGGSVFAVALPIAGETREGSDGEDPDR